MKKRFSKLGIGIVLVSLLLASFAWAPKAFAGTLTAASIIEMGGASNVSPMIAATGQSLAIAFTTANAGATSVTIAFTGWNGGAAGSVNATQTVSNTGCTALTGASLGLPGSITAAGSGSTITISSVTALAATTSYCTELTSTSAVTNPTATGDYNVTITAGSDNQTVAVDVLSAGQNAYSITATIAPTFTMALSSTTDTFPGNLSSTALTVSSGITTTINTNAKSGWFVWAKDSNAGLTSTQAAHTIPTVSTGSNHPMNGGVIGTEAYAFGVSAFNTASYAYGGGTTGGGLSTGTFNQIATSNTTATNATFVSHELADISATSPPASDYTDTITLIGAGSF